MGRHRRQADPPPCVPLKPSPILKEKVTRHQLQARWGDGEGEGRMGKGNMGGCDNKDRDNKDGRGEQVGEEERESRYGK